MTDPTKNDPAEVSRRAMLQKLALTAGGCALLAATATGARPALAAGKTSQKAVAYQDTPHGTQRCDNCRQFEPPNACKVVDGEIKPEGWCKVYVKAPAPAPAG